VLRVAATGSGAQGNAGRPARLPGPQAAGPPVMRTRRVVSTRASIGVWLRPAALGPRERVLVRPGAWGPCSRVWKPSSAFNVLNCLSFACGLPAQDGTRTCFADVYRESPAINEKPCIDHKAGLLFASIVPEPDPAK